MEKRLHGSLMMTYCSLVGTISAKHSLILSAFFKSKYPPNIRHRTELIEYYDISGRYILRPWSGGKYSKSLQAKRRHPLRTTATHAYPSIDGVCKGGCWRCHDPSVSAQQSTSSHHEVPWIRSPDSGGSGKWATSNIVSEEEGWLCPFFHSQPQPIIPSLAPIAIYLK